MNIDSNNLLNSILESLERIEYIKPEDIPGIDLYMDQVTTFMDKRLMATVRNPENDKILTKTMINNYTKNNLIPPPDRKKYSKEHILLLIFIYYCKNIMSITDIQSLLGPITESYFGKKSEFSLESIYREVVGMEKQQIAEMKEDVIKKFRKSEEYFQDVPNKDKEFLQKFMFICLLGFDVYVKKLLIEKLIDELPEKQSEKKTEKSPKTQNTKAPAKTTNSKNK